MLFERAAKSKLRFQSNKGLLSVEDLYDLSLNSLDTIAKSINKRLKEETEESFIEAKSSSSTVLELQLDILKHIINDKLQVREANQKRAETMQRNQEIKEILARKKVKELEGKSVEELTSMLS